VWHSWVSASDSKQLGEENPYMNRTIGQKKAEYFAASSSDMNESERLLAPSNRKRV
jgi:hypothetical protein